MSSSVTASAGEEAEEVVLQITVPGVSLLEDVAFSKAVQMRGHQWRIMVVHREVTAQTLDGKKDVMGAYIQRVGPKMPPQPASNWSIVVNASVTLVNQHDAEKNYTKEFRHQYTRNSTDWGYSTFLRWKEVINPLKGFVKDDTIILRARLVYPGPDAHADPAPSSSQSHSIPSLSTSSPSAQPNSQNHTHSPRHAHSGTSSQPTLLPLIKPLSLSLSTPALSPRTFSLSQSSQDSEGSQLTPTSMSVLPPEMAAFLSCPRCSEHYEEEGRRSPNTLHCGHTFCLDCLTRLAVQGEGGKQRLTCSTCGQEHLVLSSDTKPWFPNHSMVQLIRTVLSKAKHFCPIHQHDRNYYCFQDKTLVCIYCAYHGDHTAHQCRPVKEAKQVIRDGLRAVRIQAQGRTTELERRLRLIRDEQEGVRTQAQNSARLVEEYFVNLETALRRQRDLLLQDLHSHTSDLHSTFETQVRDLEKHLSQARRSLEEYDTWKALPAREALTRVGTITQTLQATASTSLPRELQQSSCPRLRVCVELPCTNPLTSLGPLGHVTVTCPSPSPLLGSTDRTFEQDGQSVEVVSGKKERELEPQREAEAETQKEAPAVLVDAAADTVVTTDTQEGENSVGGGGVLVNWRLSDTDTSPASKRRKT